MTKEDERAQRSLPTAAGCICGSLAATREISVRRSRPGALAAENRSGGKRPGLIQKEKALELDQDPAPGLFMNGIVCRDGSFEHSR